MKNTTTALVSVAIITYNQKDFLKEAIDSVLEQDYENIEIVVGDDCSTDGTQQMLREYEQQHPGKFVLKLAEKNSGITVNSNAVHFACTGKYIAWLGGDDLMLPGKISKQVAFMESHPDHNIVYHHLDVFESSTNSHIKFYNTSRDTYTGGVVKSIRHGTFNGACSTMVRHSASPDYGFDERLPVASDWLYWVEHLIHGGKIGFISEVLGRHRRHDKNVSNRSSPMAAQGYRDFLQSCAILAEKYPQYKKDVAYGLSEYHRGLRMHDYKNNLRKSLQYYNANLRSRVLLLAYQASFGKIRL